MRIYILLQNKKLKERSQAGNRSPNDGEGKSEGSHAAAGGGSAGDAALSASSKLASFLKDGGGGGNTKTGE